LDKQTLLNKKKNVEDDGWIELVAFLVLLVKVFVAKDAVTCSVLWLVFIGILLVRLNRPFLGKDLGTGPPNKLAHGAKRILDMGGRRE